MAGFGVSGVEPSGSATTLIVIHSFSQSVLPKLRPMLSGFSDGHNLIWDGSLCFVLPTFRYNKCM